MSRKTKEPNFKVGECYDIGISMLPTQERIDNLSSIAYKTSKETYTKPLTREELDEKKSLLAEVSIDLSEMEEEKKELIKEMKTKMELPLLEKKELLQCIKMKSERKEGQLFYIDDQENGLMYMFDENAICVDFRPLRNEEKQLKINSTLKIASNE